MDLEKYRNLFVEEGREHLGQFSEALLALEKDPSAAEAIDCAFRMAHSVKGMAASLGYDAITELAHRLEDRLEDCRSAGRVAPGDEIARLFDGLEGLERMVAAIAVREEPPAADAALLEHLAGPAAPSEPTSGGDPPKKAPGRR